MRIGLGFDIHQFVKGRPLILGGLKIPYAQGLQGHSDADVLLHALMDALLGALGLGDIGRHFPDTDPAYKGISSLMLLDKVKEKIQEAGYLINNIDGVIMAEEPKLAPFITKMEQKIAKALVIEADLVNLKATTMEKLGPIGQKKGIAAQVVVSLKKERFAG